MTAPAFSVTVYGRPAPQGSKSHKGKGRMVESSKYVKPWRERVTSAALDAIQHLDWVRLDQPLVLGIDFYVDRSKGHFGTGRNAGRLKPSAPAWPTSTPDLSKLIRSTEDSFTDAGIWRDDSLVVQVRAAKRYVDDGPGALCSPGAVVRVWLLEPRLTTAEEA